MTKTFNSPVRHRRLFSILLLFTVLASSPQHNARALFGESKPKRQHNANNMDGAASSSQTCSSSSASGSCITVSQDLIVPLLASTLAITGACFYFLYNSISKSFQTQLNNLQVQLSGKTNSAFVFIKPHACKGNPGLVEAVVEDGLTKAGIRITGRGEIDASMIDSNKLIDTHYGAIASKAVQLQPRELNVPTKGQQDFQEMFGESWEDALAASRVYNAKDAAIKLGVDGAGLETKWRKLKSGVNLIKFGGGFYCGKIDDIYVMNGFYMAMRAAYCNPGEKIKWYTVSWPSDSLSWEDFRGKVLGATDPTIAAKGSIRQTIYWQYNSLGLDSKPNTGNNGVHASASPLEGLAERMNWLGVDPQQDEFGKALLATGIDDDTIRKWVTDSQVKVEGETEPGKTMSVFDALEDLDADTVLAKVKKIG